MNVVEAFLAEQRRRLRVEVHEPLSTLALTPRFRASSHVIFLVFTPRTRHPYLVAKMPRLLDGGSRLAREAANLAEVQQLRPGGFDSVPRVIAFEPFRGRPLLIETALGGRLMNPAYVRRHPDRCCGLMSDWLIELQHASALTAGTDWLDTIAGTPLARFRARFPATAEEDAMIERTLAAAATLAAAHLPFVFEHGDLSHPNIMLSGRHSVGILDWELAQRRGLIAADLFVFLAYVAFSRARAASAEAQVNAVRQAFAPHGWAAAAAITFARRAGIDDALLSPLLLLCWARYTAALLDRLMEGDGTRHAVAGRDTASWLRGNRYFLLWRDHARTLLDSSR
jgi:aminoglycoside phosphotransferase (APT) family kinase protein